jgi:1,2-diacylglycerol 3-alpha-glucosyltransferase
VLCGDGPERANLESFAQQSAYAAEVHFPGLKSSRELLPFYAGAGCFVLPSTREPWGLVVNEAMAAELPVLVSDRCGCAPDLVREGENGFRFDPSQSASLAEQLLRMERRNESERAEMGRKSGEIIARFTPEAFGAAIAGIAGVGRQMNEAVGAAEVIS